MNTATISPGSSVMAAELPRATANQLGSEAAREILHLLPAALERSGETNWSACDPCLHPVVRSALTPRALDGLIGAGVVAERRRELVWRFQPFFGEGLLLFRDLEARRFEREYVWLRTKTESGSWRFSEYFDPRPGMKVLDLGTGSGLNALRAAARGARAAGIDLNPRAIEVAQLNAKLNGFDAVEFSHCDWNHHPPDGFDLVVSQPPFDPEIRPGQEIYAFGGGGEFGLEYCSDILRRYAPKLPGQRLCLYMHSFAKEEESLLERVVQELLPAHSKYTLEHRRSYSVEEWWRSYTARHQVDHANTLPKQWRVFDSVRAYFLTIQQRTETSSK